MTTLPLPPRPGCCCCSWRVVPIMLILFSAALLFSSLPLPSYPPSCFGRNFKDLFTGGKADYFHLQETNDKERGNINEYEHYDRCLWKSGGIRSSSRKRRSKRSGRRNLRGVGSSPPRCTSKCGKCTPCKPVHVPVPPGTPVTAEYYPEAWRCKCGNKLYMP